LAGFTDGDIRRMILRMMQLKILEESFVVT
jgi:hypothetical protein